MSDPRELPEIPFEIALRECTAQFNWCGLGDIVRERRYELSRIVRMAAQRAFQKHAVGTLSADVAVLIRRECINVLAAFRHGEMLEAGERVPREDQERLANVVYECAFPASWRSMARDRDAWKDPLKWPIAEALADFSDPAGMRYVLLRQIVIVFREQERGWKDGRKRLRKIIDGLA